MCLTGSGECLAGSGECPTGSGVCPTGSGACPTGSGTCLTGSGACLSDSWACPLAQCCQEAVGGLASDFDAVSDHEVIPASPDRRVKKGRA